MSYPFSKYQCQKYTSLGEADGGTTVVQKGPADCIKQGNAISGFNEAACGTFCICEFVLTKWAQLSHGHIMSLLTYPDVYYGSWCASPRNCSALVSCVEAEIIKVRESRTRRAFLEYLEEAPKIEVVDVGDPEKCGELREYFDYAKDYVDDLRIREVKDLQVRHRS